MEKEGENFSRERLEKSKGKVEGRVARKRKKGAVGERRGKKEERRRKGKEWGVNRLGE
jgi:hypothetical protein